MSYRKKALLKVIILGDSAVGKTSLLQRYVEKKFDHRHKATIGADFLIKEVDINGTTVTLQIWDTAGQDRFQTLGSAFYRGADACLLVFDITSQQSFSHISAWRDEFAIQAGEDKVYALIGNKCDMEDQRQVSAAAAVKWCDKMKTDQDLVIPFFETSAKEFTNVEQAFHQITEIALQKVRKLEDDEPEIPSLKLKPGDGNRRTGKKTTCC